MTGGAGEDDRRPDRDRDPDRAEGLTQNAPGLARLAVEASWNTTRWAAGLSLKAGSRVARATVGGENPAVVIGEAATELRSGARRLLGIPDPEKPGPLADETVEGARPPESEAEHALRERGAELLRRSADVNEEEGPAGSHPAYERILDEIAPDEARILRLLATKGPQPAVDVRTWRPLGVGSTLVAAGLSMIAAESGMRHPDRIHPHLDNLSRLGLVWFPHEPLPDPRVYQVLEAQPEVAEAMSRAGRGRTVRRTISLTSFGADFCRMALPLSPVIESETPPRESATELPPEDADLEPTTAGPERPAASGPHAARAGDDV